LTTETIKIWKFLHSSPSDYWPVRFTVGAEWHFWGIYPQALTGHRRWK